MIVTRNGQTPKIDPSAVIASTASIIGNVTIGASCYIDYNAVIESSGTPINIGDHVLVLANSVLRSTGGQNRPDFSLRVGDHTLISPSCSLVGCDIGRDCYIATGAIIFHGAEIGDGSRISAGAIVHTRTHLPPQTHVGIRHFAVPNAGSFLITPDVNEARKWIGEADFWGTVFDEKGIDKERLQGNVIEKLLNEAASWHDSER